MASVGSPKPWRVGSIPTQFAKGKIMYDYNEMTGEVTRSKIPKLKGKDARRILEAKAPKKFLEKILKMNLKVIRWKIKIIGK